jgi:hypothetical protein
MLRKPAYFCLQNVIGKPLDRPRKKIFGPVNDKDPLKNISKIILDFSASKKILGFEKYVRDNLHDSKEVELFNDIWSTTINFDNWNHSNIQIGYDKTMEILKSKYNLEENICKYLVSRAAYEWK